MTENYQLAIKLLYDIVCKPVFTKEEIEKERKVILEEYAETKDDLEDTVYENGMKSFLCKENIYHNSVIGKKTHLETMNIKDIIKYYNYRFKECIILVNCDKKFKNNIKYLLYQTFGQAKNINFNENKFIHNAKCIHKNRDKRINIIINKTTQYNSQIIFKSFKYSNIVENTILDFIKYFMTSAGLFSILYYKLREEKGLVYSITLTNEKFRYLGLVKITFGTSNKDTYNIINVIMQILTDLKMNGLDEQRLKFFKESYINNLFVSTLQLPF
jgi:predicted Zn-dependent peptidase